MGNWLVLKGKKLKGLNLYFKVNIFAGLCVYVLLFWGYKHSQPGARGGVCWRTILGNSSGLHGREPCWLCTSKQVGKSMHSFWKVFEKLTFHTCLQGLRLHVEGCGVLGFWEGAATRSSLSEINCLLSYVSLICSKSVKNMDFPSSNFYVTRKILE